MIVYRKKIHKKYLPKHFILLKLHIFVLVTKKNQYAGVFD